jgi:uncharacterized protein YjiK
MAKVPEGSVEVLSERYVGVDEASAVGSLGDDRYLVVGDEHGIFVCRPAVEEATLVHELRDAEGLCVTADRSAAYVVGEKDGVVWRFGLSGDKLGTAERLGELPRLGDDDNHGGEGIDWVASGVLGDGALLVAVHQAGPRRVGLFDAATLEPRAILKLPKKAKKALGDLNDVTVDPKTKHLLVLSGKQGVIAELELLSVDGQPELSLVRTYEIDSTRRDVPEGITFDAAGCLWTVSDGKGMLRQLRLTA